MAHSKAYCSDGEHTAMHRALYKEHMAAHMASCTYCEHSNSHKVSDKGDNHQCKVPCTGESR